MTAAFQAVVSKLPAHLVISLACCSMTHCISTNLLSNLNLTLGNERSAPQHSSRNSSKTWHVSLLAFLGVFGPEPLFLQGLC
jgi:hypothetical protein